MCLRGCDKCVVIYTHHYHVIQNSFSALQTLCSSYWSFLSSPQILVNHRTLCLYSFVFYKMSYSWNHTLCSHYRLNFHLAICITSASKYFCGLIAHVFLSLNNILFMNASHFLYSFSYWKIFCLLIVFCNYEQSCYIISPYISVWK